MKRTLLSLVLALAAIGGISAQKVSDITWPMWTECTETQESKSNGALNGAKLEYSNLQASDNKADDAYVRFCMEDKCEWVTKESQGTYLQFSVAPGDGTSFLFNSFSFEIAGFGTVNMRANFYYAKKADFSDKKKLEVLSGENMPREQFTLFNAVVSPEFKVDDNERLYIRVYPFYNTEVSSESKYFTIRDVKISGVTKVK